MLPGFRAQGSGFRVQGSGFGIQGSGFRVQGSGFTIKLRGYCCRKCTLLISRAVLHQRWGSQEYKTEVEVQHTKNKYDQDYWQRMSPGLHT